MNEIINDKAFSVVTLGHNNNIKKNKGNNIINNCYYCSSTAITITTAIIMTIKITIVIDM